MKNYQYRKFYVSVIVPNYNHAPYLEQRIESILAQTYQSFELIILDDCSPDNGASRRVVEKYRNNPHVSHIVYNETNSGSTFKQWNKGFLLAKGELIWLAESDDFCEPTLLENLVAEFKRDDELVLAFTLLSKVDSYGRKIPYCSWHPWWNIRMDGKEFVRRYMTVCNYCANASGALFRKDTALGIDPQYTTYKAGGDWLFWIELAEQGRVAIVNKRLNYFRQHGVKVTTASSLKGINSKEALRTIDYIRKHFDLPKWRDDMMMDVFAYGIQNNKYESEYVRNELKELYGIKDGLNFVKRVKAKTVKVLNNRLNIFL